MKILMTIKVHEGGNPNNPVQKFHVETDGSGNSFTVRAGGKALLADGSKTRSHPVLSAATQHALTEATAVVTDL